MDARPASRPGRAGRRRCSAAWVLVALFLMACAYAAEVRCSVCGKGIRGRYLQADGQAFCSRECYRRTLPVCAVCGSVIEGKHLRHDGKTYCSDRCFEQTLPKCSICGQPMRQSVTINGRMYCPAHAELPRCTACGLPVAESLRLPDGRLVCPECHPHLVFETADAEKLYYRAAAVLRRIVGRDLPLLPPLELAGQDLLPVHQGLDPGTSVHEQGRYVREVETTAVKFFGRTLREDRRVSRRIVMLYGLSESAFLGTAAHELAHNLISEWYPRFDREAPDWAEEGVCQYVAALVCRRLGLEDRLKEIEAAPDPVYGGGYRSLRKLFGPDDWQALANWLEAGDFAALQRVP
ncbi:MAG: hypothetical protein JXR77_00510 [Lentisphaeria bacterium]|nr:hypothetical protein [Lentisphaeria bacterium]